MKEVWYERTQMEYQLKNGKHIIGESHMSNYKYSLPPLYNEYSHDLNWKELGKYILHYNYMGKTLFKRREYITVESDYSSYTRIYKEELEKVILHKKVYILNLNTVSLSHLHEQLSFNDYSQLIFDREQKLTKEKLNDTSNTTLTQELSTS